MLETKLCLKVIVKIKCNTYLAFAGSVNLEICFVSLQTDRQVLHCWVLSTGVVCFKLGALYETLFQSIKWAAILFYHRHPMSVCSIKHNLYHNRYNYLQLSTCLSSNFVASHLSLFVENTWETPKKTDKRKSLWKFIYNVSLHC